MIVQPGFLDHWKTQKLVDLLGPVAPLYVIRIWSHCQQMKTDVLPNETLNLRAICKADVEADKLVESLISCGFVEKHKKKLTAHGWKKENIRLFTNAKNGKLGGRPKSQPDENPSDIIGIAKQISNKTRSKGIREEKSRVDKTLSPTPPRGESESGFECPERIRPAFEALLATGKIPNLTPQLVAEVDKFHPDTPLSEHYAVVALELKHITGVCGNPLRWLVDSIRKNVEQKKIRARHNEVLGGENYV
jgi:hypothetical protein